MSSLLENQSKQLLKAGSLEACSQGGGTFKLKVASPLLDMILGTLSKPVPNDLKALECHLDVQVHQRCINAGERLV